MRMASNSSLSSLAKSMFAALRCLVNTMVAACSTLGVGSPLEIRVTWTITAIYSCLAELTM